MRGVMWTSFGTSISRTRLPVPRASRRSAFNCTRWMGRAPTPSEYPKVADGLYYARQLGCTHLVDAATLTGAVVVALGYNNAGIFANDDDMYNRFHSANAKAGEKMWRLPLDDEYKEHIRSSIADIVNSGGRWGGAITAAMFLKEFAEETPWIHL